jgi:hypothetical protein
MPRIKGFVTNFGDRLALMIRPPAAGRVTAPASAPIVRLARFGVVAAGMLALAACNATEQDSPVRGAATSLGFATTVPPAKDFVVARRPRGELDYVPVGREGTPRPVQPRTIEGVRELERNLDAVRDRSEGFARRPLPRGAYGQPLPSVARPPRAAQRPNSNTPDSYPVSPSRARELRDNARRVQQ